jgi:hypothetical protein
VQALLVLGNTAVFALIGALSYRSWRESKWVLARPLWLTLALLSGIAVVGGVQRLAFQGVNLGYLDSGTLDLLTNDWQLIQSLAVGVGGVYALFVPG